MLILIIKEEEAFNNQTGEFHTLPEVKLELEHSLVSLSKWESKFERPFLGKEGKTHAETLGYIEAMILSSEISPGVIFRLRQEHFDAINEYIEAKQTATTFGELPQEGRSRTRPETITSELIYYWMVAYNIPFEVERWHLNRLFALIRICNLKNSKPKRMSKQELARRNRDLNEKRRRELGTSG
jgi:hypothetical protein